MHVGFAELKLSPAQFWSMTPRELQAALAPLHASVAAAPTRSSLAALMSRFPDHEENWHG
jgi:uncharacterized phage protein (TIGR02216 family)